MKVTLKLYASLGAFLPAGALKNQAEIEVGEGATIESVLERYNVPREACHLVLLNGVFQAPARRAAVRLNEGDALAIWPPVAGG